MRTPGALTLACAGLCAVLATDAGAEDGDVVRPQMETDTLSGFRTEGAPEIEVVFGDADRYERHVDDFYRHEEAMTATRGEFYRHVQAAIATLAAHKRGPCPADALAPLYFRAHQALEGYTAIGADYEAEYLAIVQLDGLGETSALTPDYRWKVNRVRGLYRDALVDYREMRAAMRQQLGSELDHRRCKRGELLARGAEVAPATDHAIAPPPSGNARKPRTTEAPMVPASPVTFFIDNRNCEGPLKIYIDEALLGEVSAGAKAAFQALSGRHTLCLIPRDAAARCGQTGTVRSAYVYDGWSVTMYCRAPEPVAAVNAASE